jgi:hypothetical protein
MAKVAETHQLYKQSMEEFFKVAKYPLVKHCDMTAEMKEEAVDVCITAVEKFPNEREKCTQVCEAVLSSTGTCPSIMKRAVPNGILMSAADQGYHG